MPSITKKDTSKLKHYTARTITNIQIVHNDVDGEETPYLAFIGGRGGSGGSVETVIPMTPEAWSRAAMGTGASSEPLRNGLDMASRFRFKVLTDEVKNGDNTTEMVVGVHCIPDDNYIRCNFGLTLNRPNITEDMAVVQVHEKSGEIDIIAFPDAIRKNVDSFLKELETITEFDNTTTFTSEGITYTIVNAFGSELTFRCFKRR
jgi:hypothetical protein